LELRCVRPSVRTSTKSFSDFHLIWCVGRPRPHMRISVTSTQSKVKVKVMELPKLRKVHYSRSISSAVLACSSKLMVDGHITGPGLQLVGARFLGHRLGDDLVDWNSGVSVRQTVRPYVHKKFFRFPSNLVCG